MRLRLPPVALLAILLAACGTPTPEVTTGVTPSVGPSVTPAPSETPGIVANVNCPGLSLYVDPALASGFTCDIVPESTELLDPHPEYTMVTLQGYPLSDGAPSANISVFPVADYTVLMNAIAPDYPDWIPGRVTDLLDLIGGGPTPAYVGPLASSLPYLPIVEAGQVFLPVQYQVLPFESGTGIRYLTQMSQWSPPVNNAELWYTYQGLTDDGQYWISVTLPISHPMLPAAEEPLPGGVTNEEWVDNYMPYITDMIDQLNAEPSGSFTPSIDDLDTLVASITIQP